MEQIKTRDQSIHSGGRLPMVWEQVANGLKWWAEHQAWPATDEIRIEPHNRSNCG